MKKILIIPIVLALFIMTSCSHSPSSAKYELTPKQALENALKSDNQISAEELVQMLTAGNAKEQNYVFIDIRTPKEFDDSHIPDAINIPFRNLVNKETSNDRLLADKVNILYGQNSDQVAIAASILQQIGRKNVMMCPADYTYIQNHILKTYSIYSGNYSDEKARYDYAKIVAETQGASVGTAASSGPAPVASGTAPVKKKKSGGGGGCE